MAILVVELTPESRARVRALARLPELRGDHVTLAHGIAVTDLDPRWIPGGAQVGDTVRIRARSLHRDAQVQALKVELGGTAVRPHDGGILHITVSRAPGARSSDSNRLLDVTPGEPVTLELEGVVGWREERRGA